MDIINTSLAVISHEQIEFGNNTTEHTTYKSTTQNSSDKTALTLGCHCLDIILFVYLLIGMKGKRNKIRKHDIRN